MFIHALDSTTSYRAVARGVGCGFARAYRISQQDLTRDQRPTIVNFAVRGRAVAPAESVAPTVSR
jgi:hypothetical protein